MSINSKYYNENKDSFIENTINCDMSFQYNYFLKHMNKSGTILDLGFGSGRDMMYFNKLGYSVIGIDTTDSFVSIMKDKGFEVYLTTAQEMNFENKFDGIWACASLLHVPSNELELAFKKCEKALKDDGVLYCSFKYGTYEGERNGRIFTDLNELLISNYLENTQLVIVDTMITTDVRPDREEKWLNCILKKN